MSNEHTELEKKSFPLVGIEEFISYRTIITGDNNNYNNYRITGDGPFR